MTVKNKLNKGKLWQVQQPDEKIVNTLVAESELPESLIRILVNRGYYDHDSIERFIGSKLDMLHDPLLMNGMLSAAERIIVAIEKKEHILIHGDYDVDGVTSTALLMYVLKDLGANVSYFVPNRISDGYGLSINNIKTFVQTGVNLIITVDCGVTSFDEIKYAQKAGVDVIVTDHHEPKIDGAESVNSDDERDQINIFEIEIKDQEKSFDFKVILPEAYAIINPKLGDYPCSDLAGVGVAFKLAHGLLKVARQKNIEAAFNVNLKDHLDLVALGTAADAVPLRDENRILVKYGLKELSQSKKPGLMKLVEMSNLREMNVLSVVFRIAPKINAAGRLAEASKAVELMLTNSFTEGEIIVKELDDLNRERQRIERETTKMAIEQFESQLGFELPISKKLDGGLKNYIPDGPNVIVLANQEWNPGVIGIVASRMVDRYYLPSVIISLTGNDGKGSCRSTREFHMFDALAQSSHLLEGYGGHRIAAGLSVDSDKIDLLRDNLDKIAQETLSDEDVIPHLNIDAAVALTDCNDQFRDLLEFCEPYGQQNPQPTLLIERVKLVEEPTILKEKHLKFCVLKDGVYKTVIAFNWADRLDEIMMWQRLSIVVRPYLNYFRSEVSLELQLIDAKESRDEKE